MLRRDRGRADDHLGAVRLEHVALVLADLVGADEDALVALAPARPSPARRRCCRRSARRSCRRAGARRRPRPPRSSASAMRSFTEPPGLRYSTLASTSGPSSGGRRSSVGEPDERGVADQVEERVRVLHLHVRALSGAEFRSYLGAWGRPGRHASWRPRRRTAAAASRVLGAALYGLLRAEAKLARRAIGDADGRAARRHRLVRPRPPGPGDQGRAARRLQRGRVRRRPRRGDARAPCSGRAGRRARRPSRLPARRSRWSAPSPRDLAGQIDRALPIEPTSP